MRSGLRHQVPSFSRALSTARTGMDYEQSARCTAIRHLRVCIVSSRQAEVAQADDKITSTDRNCNADAHVSGCLRRTVILQRERRCATRHCNTTGSTRSTGTQGSRDQDCQGGSRQGSNRQHSSRARSGCQASCVPWC